MKKSIMTKAKFVKWLKKIKMLYHKDIQIVNKDMKRYWLLIFRKRKTKSQWDTHYTSTH